MADFYRCPFDGLPCDKFIYLAGFGACYVRGLDGKMLSVCHRFVVKAGVSVVTDLVSSDLIPK
jgi:hypothetical protein